MKLILPCATYEASYREYIEELGDEERYPFPLDFDHTNFAQMLQRNDDFANGRNLPEGFVQSTTLWLVEDGNLLGVTNIRHHLNDKIRHCGGHIGLGIRPSRRGQGLGKHLMALSIERARELGNQEVHIHCHTHNQASANMILACGGELDSQITVGDEHVSRYLVR